MERYQVPHEICRILPCMSSRGDADGPDAAPTEHVALNLAPFAAAAALAAVVAIIGTEVDWTTYAIAVGLGVVAGLSRLWPSRGPFERIKEVLPSLIFLISVAFLRSSAGGSQSGVAVVALLPVFWTALYGNRIELCIVAVGLAVFFFAPPLLVGAPAYPDSQYRAGALFLAVSAIIGFTTQWLVSEVRFQVREAEHRERAVEQIAAVMRGLSNSPRAREEVCEAARSIGNATFALLYEPTEHPDTLRATAAAGIEVTPPAIAPENNMAVSEAFASRRAFLWRVGDDAKALNRDVWKAVGSPESILFEPVFKDDDLMGLLVVGWPEAIRSRGTRATMISLIAHEIAEAIERADLLSHLTDMASTDALTGLPNRRAWEASLSRLVPDKDESYVLAMFDFDHFKVFNDTNGHPAGDRLLKETAAAWREELRTGDFLARIGGEEFALLLPKCSPRDALMVVERLRKRVPYGQTCSAGIAVSEPGERSDSLLDRVDAALYEAKAAGRDRVSIAG
jgi:diguanylate cyclase (GGDEF)-like protein